MVEKRKRGEAMKTVEVAAGVLTDGARILATQRGYGEWKDYWEFPGGKLEPGETPELALRRELREELRIEIDILQDLGTVEYDYPAFHLRMSCFLARIREGTPVLEEHEAARWLLPWEVDSLQWLPADRLVLPRIIGR